MEYLTVQVQKAMRAVNWPSSAAEYSAPYACCDPRRDRKCRIESFKSSQQPIKQVRPLLDLGLTG